MKREFGVEANVGAPQVAYRETMKKPVESEGKFIRQSGGRGQYGHVWLKLDPQPPGTGYEFVDGIKGGRVPREFIRREERDRRGASGRRARGLSVVDVKATLFDGSYHEVDSSEQAFKMAAIFASRTACARPTQCCSSDHGGRVETPEEKMGDVMGDLSSRRPSSGRRKTRRGQGDSRRRAARRDVPVLHASALAHSGAGHLYDGVQALRRGSEEHR